MSRTRVNGTCSRGPRAWFDDPIIEQELTLKDALVDVELPAVHVSYTCVLDKDGNPVRRQIGFHRDR